jgi:hypothetical protein
MANKYKNGAWKSTSDAQDAFSFMCFEKGFCGKLGTDLDQVHGGVMFHLYTATDTKVVDVVVNRKGIVQWTSIPFYFDAVLA